MALYWELIRSVGHLAERVRTHVLLCMLAYYLEWHLRKVPSRTTDDGEPVHSFQGLLRNLATLSQNRIVSKLPDAPAFTRYTTPTPFQKRALDLLDVPITCSQNQNATFRRKSRQNNDFLDRASESFGLNT